jgi:tetratricopeptide (TPR) repeat protein
VKIASPKLQTSRLSRSDEALYRCEVALKLKDRGDYEGAQEAMRPLWKGVGEQPDVSGLHDSITAEVLLCAGILTGWIGSKRLIESAQETAKNLLTESITCFESAGDVTRIAAARAEIAYCYWRQGELSEARIMLREALQRLNTASVTRGRAILKLVTVENTAARYYESLKLLTDNAALFQKISDPTTRGDYHNELAITLDIIATAEKQSDYLTRAVGEYKAADRYFKLAKNPIFRASVKNNVGILLSKMSRYKEAHKYLDEARRLTLSLGDKSRTAQIDETRAQILIAEGKLKNAEAVARRAASSLEKIGHKCLRVDALITQGVALARLGQIQRANYIFQSAIEIALEVNARNKAGLAALTLIEEVDQLSPATLQAAYQQAREWLKDSQGHDMLLRLNDAAGKLATSLRGEITEDDATEILLSKGFDLQGKMSEYERSMIKQALAQANGRITHAASLLRLTYQGLAYIIQSRHPDLLTQRTPVRRRVQRPKT